MRWFAAALVGSLASACASDPKVSSIVGPDGSSMFHLSCAGQEARCFQLAGERCPGGYDLTRTQQGRDTFLLRCRAPGQISASSTWAPRADLAPSPYGAPPVGSPSTMPYARPLPVTTVPPGYPPLAPGSGPKNDVGY
ncbi:MAG: hypothetical protein IT375_19500 [Polyangiaceae bacterium]|nr:hypothetical protein [Polyangiaceae bacterium]